MNIIFVGNFVDNAGGAMFNNGKNGISNPTLTNVTFYGNSVKCCGGAMVNDGENTGTSIPELCNSIVWNNLDRNGTGTISASISLTKGASISLTHSLVQGSGVSSGSWIGGSYVDSGGNIDTDPLFVATIDPSIAPTKTGNLRLRENSSAIDQGYDSFIAGILTDLDGEARAVDGNLDGTPTVDMGAYEYHIPCLFDGYIPLIFR